MNKSIYKKICVLCIFIFFTFSFPVMGDNITTSHQNFVNNGVDIAESMFITDENSDDTNEESAQNDEIHKIVIETLPTAAPTITPTIVPTATPTVAPTIVPTATPTIAPTVAPTVVPTITPTPESTPIAAPDDKLIYALNCSNAFINGKLINTYTTPYMYDGLSMLPIERIIEFLGGSCSYNTQTRILTLYLNDKSADISVDDEYCAIFETMFYPVRLIADKLGINMAWYNGIVVLSNNEPWIYGDEPNTYKKALGYTGYDDRIWTNRPTPEHFIYPYDAYSYNQMNNDLHALKRMYPDLFSRVYSIGKSEEGRDILAINFGKGDTKIILCAAMHAREYISTTFVMNMLDRYAYSYFTNEICENRYNARNILDSVTFIVVPQINPDGINLVQNGICSVKDYQKTSSIPFTSDGGAYKYRSWKSNINGVNLNANFPVLWKHPYGSPNSTSYTGSCEASEKETQAMVELINNTDFEVFASIHAQGEVIYWMDGNCDRSLVGKFKPYVDRICNETGYTKMPQDHNSGTGRAMTDYVRYYKKKMAITVEMCPYVGPFPYPDSDFDRAEYPIRNLGYILAEVALDLKTK